MTYTYTSAVLEISKAAYDEYPNEAACGGLLNEPGLAA